MSAVRKTVHLPITHIVCDCDGVLVDSESVAYLALVDALSARLHRDRVGNKVNDDVKNSSLSGLSGEGGLSGARDIEGAAAGNVGTFNLAHAIQQRLGLTIDVLLGQVAALAGEVLSEHDIAAMRDHVEGAVRSRQTAVPGIASALSTIGLPVAVASNSSLSRVREAVACSGVGAIVGDRLFTADVVGVPKPAPDIYLAACAGFAPDAAVGSPGSPSSLDVAPIVVTTASADDAPSPGHCLAIEDSLAGVRSAVSAGLQVLGFAGGGHIAAGPGGAAHLIEHVHMLKNAGAFAVFDDMRALPGIVAAIQKRALHQQTDGEAAPFLSAADLIRLPAVIGGSAR